MAPAIPADRGISIRLGEWLWLNAVASARSRAVGGLAPGIESTLGWGGAWQAADDSMSAINSARQSGEIRDMWGVNAGAFHGKTAGDEGRQQRRAGTSADGGAALGFETAEGIGESRAHYWPSDDIPKLIANY